MVNKYSIDEGFFNSPKEIIAANLSWLLLSEITKSFNKETEFSHPNIPKDLIEAILMSKFWSEIPCKRLSQKTLLPVCPIAKAK